MGVSACSVESDGLAKCRCVGCSWLQLTRRVYETELSCVIGKHPRGSRLCGSARELISRIARGGAGLGGGGGPWQAGLAKAEDHDSQQCMIARGA
jgi:hypothetical protein